MKNIDLIIGILYFIDAILYSILGILEHFAFFVAAINFAFWGVIEVVLYFDYRRDNIKSIYI